jgi:hypothetical protein
MDREEKIMAEKYDDLAKVAKEEGLWQRFIKKRQSTKDGFIPDPAAAPIGTDQEAGGAISTPRGTRRGS